MTGGATLRLFAMAGGCLLGCGSSVSVPGESTAGGPSPTPTSSPATPAPTPPPAPAPVGLCGAPATAPVLAVSEGAALALVYGDGSRRELDPGFGMLPPGELRLRWMLDGHRLIVLATSRQPQAGPNADGLVSVFDAAGELLVRIEQPGVELHGVATGDDGTFLVSRLASGGSWDYAVVRDGAAQALPADVTPLGGRYAGGVVRALVGAGEAFYDLATEEVALASSAVGAVSTFARGDAFVSVHDAAPPLLMLERASGVTVFDVETVDESPTVLQPVSFGGGHLVLQSQDTGRAWRIDLDDGDDLLLPAAPPGGGPPESMSYCRPAPVVGTGGEVLMVGGEDALRFQTFAPASATWTTLGEPLTFVETVTALERDGTWVLRGVVGTFCPGVVAEGSGGLAGVSTQVVRPGVGAYVLEPEVTVAIRDGGGCVGYGVPEGIEVLDLATGATSVVAGTRFAFWPQRP